MMERDTAPAAVPAWQLQGQIVVACNCDFGCPCNFNGLPTTGKCEGNWNWCIESGAFGDVSLASLNFSLAVNWPGPIHDGNGEALFTIDERADDAQRAALQTLVGGQAGGPWQIISTTIRTMHGPEFVPYEVAIDGYRSTARVGDYITVEMEPVRNKKTGAESFPRILLPEGFVFKAADAAASKTFRVTGPVSFDHSGRYAALAPFDYAGP